MVYAKFGGQTVYYGEFENREFFLGNSRVSETRARVKITPREKRRHAAGREKTFSRVG